MVIHKFSKCYFIPQSSVDLRAFQYSSSLYISIQGSLMSTLIAFTNCDANLFGSILFTFLKIKINLMIHFQFVSSQFNFDKTIKPFLRMKKVLIFPFPLIISNSKVGQISPKSLKLMTFHPLAMFSRMKPQNVQMKKLILLIQSILKVMKPLIWLFFKS